MQEITYARAVPGDEPAIKSLLALCELPYEDITAFLSNFVIGRRDDQIVGVIGLEVCGRDALVRSMAVAPDFRGRGIARALNTRIFALARLLKVKELYLLTITAAQYAGRLGFQKIERKDAPESIQATGEFKLLCPQTAVCMVKRIDRLAQYYPGDILTLKDDVPGARMWGVSLDKTLLTYFECQPNCRFEKHSHPSEQITLVLKGELLFDLDGEMIRVKEGEVIAIPSNIPHAAFTESKAARACDAWSPVMPQYV